MRADRQTDGRTHRNAAGVVERLSMLERDDADDLGRALVHELLTGADWVIYDNYICDRQTDRQTDGHTHRNAAGVVARLSMLKRDDADDLG